MVLNNNQLMIGLHLTTYALLSAMLENDWFDDWATLRALRPIVKEFEKRLIGDETIILNLISMKCLGGMLPKDVSDDGAIHSHKVNHSC